MTGTSPTASFRIFSTVIRQSQRRRFLLNSSERLISQGAASHGNMESVTLKDIQEAHERLKDKVHCTPVMTSRHMDELSGRNLFFKCEHLQRTGAFKIRGVYNAMTNLMKENAIAKGVVTHSSGNQGHAMALVANELGVPCTVVVPEGTATSKTDAIRRYGGQLVTCEATYDARVAACNKVVEETGQTYISACENRDVIIGQGTTAIEFLQQVPSLDAILAPVSGGGLAAGVTVAAKSLKPSVKVYLVSPKGKMLKECLQARQRLWEGPQKLMDTIADGIRLQQMGHLPFSLVCGLVEDDAIEVADEDMVDAMKKCFGTMKQVIESAAAAVVSAALNHDFPAEVQNIGVILCGGNIDLDKLPW